MTSPHLSSEQEMLQDMLSRFLRDRSGNARLPDEVTDTADQRLWEDMSALGLPGLLAPEQAEAMDGAVMEAMLVQRELGRHAATAPFLSHAVLSMLALRAQHEAAGDWISRAAEGSARLAVAMDDVDSRYDWQAPQATARVTASGTTLQGVKRGVRHAPGADAFIVNARLAAPGSPLAVFAVPAGGCTLLRRYRSLDGAALADVQLPASQVDAVLLAQGEAAQALVESLQGWWVAGLCSQAVGAMESACALTAQYLQERRQFGQSLAQFQVLRHRFIDMRIHLLKAESMAALAAGCVEDEPGAERRKALRAAVLIVNEASRFVGQQAIHLHGAIGMTAEYSLGALVRQLTTTRLLSGDGDFRVEALA